MQYLCDPIVPWDEGSFKSQKDNLGGMDASKMGKAHCQYNSS